MGRIDYETETLVTHAVAIPILEAGARTGVSTTDPRAGIGVGEDGDPMFTLQSGNLEGQGGARESTLIAFCNAGGDTALSTSEHTAPPITTRHGDPGLIAFSCKDSGADASEVQEMNIASPWAVRRLTPTECEKLMGCEPGWTAIQYRGKDAAGGNRYRALGNSMAVPVMRWIGQQIQRVTDNIKQ
jgi:DNA (cytosine-5)-methyltransferase 1